jgi:hypothetical protein
MKLIIGHDCEPVPSISYSHIPLPQDVLISPSDLLLSLPNALILSCFFPDKCTRIYSVLKISHVSSLSLPPIFQFLNNHEDIDQTKYRCKIAAVLIIQQTTLGVENLVEYTVAIYVVYKRIFSTSLPGINVLDS